MGLIVRKRGDSYLRKYVGIFRKIETFFDILIYFDN